MLVTLVSRIGAILKVKPVDVQEIRDSKTNPMRIRPALKVEGRLSIPGDKSISHRAAIIAALAQGTSELAHFATGQDCASTLSCLRELGVPVERDDNRVRITGVGLKALQATSAELDCGNSGSTMRMMAGVLAGQGFTTSLKGDASLSTRPMARVIEPLERMGAQIGSREGKPPLTIKGASNLNAIEYEPSVASAQVKSCVLFAGLQAKGRTVVRERQATRDHTERLLNCFGVPVEIKRYDEGVAEIGIQGQVTPVARNLRIPGDLSSAAFFIAAAALLANSDLEITGVGLNPTRIQFLSICRTLGLDVSFVTGEEECNEPVGTILIRGTQEHTAQTHLSNTLPEVVIPQLIDELPLLAVVATRVAGGLSIRKAKELRFKESDRIASTVKNLRAMGVEVDEFPDGLNVPGPQPLLGAQLESFGDHRIAMAFTVAALVAESDSVLAGSECVSVSFPEFYQLLDSVLSRN